MRRTPRDSWRFDELRAMRRQAPASGRRRGEHADLEQNLQAAAPPSASSAAAPPVHAARAAAAARPCRGSRADAPAHRGHVDSREHRGPGRAGGAERRESELAVDEHPVTATLTRFADSRAKVIGRNEVTALQVPPERGIEQQGRDASAVTTLRYGEASASTSASRPHDGREAVTPKENQRQGHGESGEVHPWRSQCRHWSGGLRRTTGNQPCRDPAAGPCEDANREEHDAARPTGRWGPVRGDHHQRVDQAHRVQPISARDDGDGEAHHRLSSGAGTRASAPSS